MEESMLAVNRDNVFGWSTERVVRSVSGAGQPAYLYVFDHCYPAMEERELCAFHASEVPFKAWNAENERTTTPKAEWEYVTEGSAGADATRDIRDVGSSAEHAEHIQAGASGPWQEYNGTGWVRTAAIRALPPCSTPADDCVYVSGSSHQQHTHGVYVRIAMRCDGKPVYMQQTGAAWDRDDDNPRVSVARPSRRPRSAPRPQHARTKEESAAHLGTASRREQTAASRWRARRAGPKLDPNCISSAN